MEVKLFSDLLKTDLHKFLISYSEKLSWEEKLELSLRIGEGIQELQQLKIIHCDIKP